MEPTSFLLSIALGLCSPPQEAIGQTGARNALPPPTLPVNGERGAEISTWPTTLEGFVLEPDGSPGKGAVVVSSAGGRAVTDETGYYQIAAQLSLDSSDVQVTATGAAGRIARATVSRLGDSGSALVGPLLLTNQTSCSPRWMPVFSNTSRPTDGPIHALTLYDDGDGTALYAGGEFTTAGEIVTSNIARWDGSRWSALGGGVTGGTVEAMAVYDDGSGPALYAAGTPSSAGSGNPLDSIAKWDGSTWTPLGSGTNGSVKALAVYDDGTGPALYAGGNFTSVGGGPISNYIARWNGSIWTSVGPVQFAFGGAVLALATYDDGNGTKLYAAGSFLTAGGVPANRIASWDGSTWLPLGSGMNATVTALKMYDYGTGPRLYAGGAFTNAGGVAAYGIARWDGFNWAMLGAGVGSGGAVNVIEVYDSGSGSALYAGGDFATAGGILANRIARWDGSTWSPLGAGVDAEVRALAVFDDGNGDALHIGGNFAAADDAPSEFLARWNGATMFPFDKKRIAGPVHAMSVFDDGGGPALYAGGSFVTAGDAEANCVARWDGSTWSPLGSGVSRSGLIPNVFALAVYDDGEGPALYVGGQLTAAGGVSANGLAKWNGFSWTALDSGVFGYVYALKAFDDGSGPSLYVGGSFTAAGGVTANGIAKWNGSSWASLSGGVNGDVKSLAVYDDGSGPALYVGGFFTTAGGINALKIAKWNGFTWSSLGPGLGGIVDAMAVYDYGTGKTLNAASGGGGRIARWDGFNWAALGGGLNLPVYALAVYDDGGGPALYAGGAFTTAGGAAANRIAKWDGFGWSPLDEGVNATVRSLTVYDDGTGEALYAGGDFLSVNDYGDNFLAKWGCPDTTPPSLACPDSVLAMDRLGSPPGEIVTFEVSATDDQDSAPVVVCTPPSGSFFPLGATQVTCTATDASGNQASCEFNVRVERKMRRRSDP